MRARYEIRPEDVDEMAMTVEITMTCAKWQRLLGLLKDAEEVKFHSHLQDFKNLLKFILEEHKSAMSTRWMSTPYSSEIEGSETKEDKG